MFPNKNQLLESRLHFEEEKEYDVRIDFERCVLGFRENSEEEDGFELIGLLREQEEDGGEVGMRNL